MPLSAPIQRMKVRANILMNLAIASAVMVFLTLPAFSQAVASNTESAFLQKVGTPKPPENAELGSTSVHPSMMYHIGPFDQIKISLLNASFAPRVLRVNGGGCIDYPLAGENVCIAGLTPAEAERSLAEAIKLFDHTVVRIDVLDYSSHVIKIAGAVEQPGDQQIARDAVPFYVVRAGVVLKVHAGSVRVIRNASQVTEDFRLNDPKLSSIYIYPGDTVEFF